MAHQGMNKNIFHLIEGMDPLEVIKVTLGIISKSFFSSLFDIALFHWSFLQHNV
jgi:hypothetical protein